jgi:hypothetical protein
MKTKAQIQESVKAVASRINVKKRGTPQGDLQREAFRLRWGIKPEDL